MEPVSLLIMCLVLSAIFVGKTATGAIHAVKGTTPASLEKTRAKLAAEQHRLDIMRDMARDGVVLPEDAKRSYGWSNVLDDASNLAAMWTGRMLQGRQDSVAQAWQRRGQEAQDRMMETYGYGPRGSADVPAASAPDGLPDATPPVAGGPEPVEGASTPDAPTPGASSSPDALDDDDRLVIPPQAGGEACDFADVTDEARQIADRCARKAADNPVALCTTHHGFLPDRASFTANAAWTARHDDGTRCAFVHKVYPHAVLRCAANTEVKSDGTRWTYCRGHRAADAAQLNGGTTPTPPAATPSAPTPPAGSAPPREPVADTPPAGEGAEICNLLNITHGAGLTRCTKPTDPTSLFRLCGDHKSLVPLRTNLDRGHAPERCLWKHKFLGDSRALRCTARTDRVDHPNNDYCYEHFAAGTGRGGRAPSCDWKSHAGVGAHAICTNDAYDVNDDPSNIVDNSWLLCRPHLANASTVASVARGEITPGRCTWVFKDLPFGTLRCRFNAAGPSDATGAPLRCEAHGGVARPETTPANGTASGTTPATAVTSGSATSTTTTSGGTPATTTTSGSSGSGGNQSKEDARDPSAATTCTHDVNCTACVKVDGVPTCVSKLGDKKPDAPAGDPATPPPAAPAGDTPSAQIIKFPKASGADMTTTETTSQAAGTEAASLAGAKEYVSALAAELTGVAADVDAKVGTMTERGMSEGPTFAALAAAQEAVNTAATKCNDALVALGAQDGIKEGFEATPEAGSKEFITGEG